MIAEREIKKLFQLVSDIHDHLGIESPHDEELEEMKKPTHVEKLADAIDEAELRSDAEGSRDPESAADTEA